MGVGLETSRAKSAQAKLAQACLKSGLSSARFENEPGGRLGLARKQAKAGS